MTRLAYITDMEHRLGGGGSYAVNWHIRDQLGKRFDLFSPDPVAPEVSGWEKTVSRVQRYVFKRPSRFFFFSQSALDRNARRVAHFFGPGIDGVFFRSSTPWCHCGPKVPYFIYLDVVFHTFFENTFERNDFLESDLQRIFQSEARFLESASAVFFESDWGMQKAKDAYALQGEHYVAVHRGGVLEPPAADTRSDQPPILLSVAMKFRQKGGDIILEAFKRLKKRYPELVWHIVGGPPSGDWRTVGGIVYEGEMNLDRPADLQRYRDLLAKAFLFLHPTREDTNPLVITEAAYFGCPGISVNRFAIPELIVDGETGVLLDWPAKAGDLADAVSRLIESPNEYRRMRKAAFDLSRKDYLWNRIGDRIAGHVNSALEQERRQH